MSSCPPRSPQVLISIQSLILVAEPYFNEPGYERDMGTARGDAASRAYNAELRRHTLEHAVCDHLARPPPAFAEVCRYK